MVTTLLSILSTELIRFFLKRDFRWEWKSALDMFEKLPFRCFYDLVS